MGCGCAGFYGMQAGKQLLVPLHCSLFTSVWISTNTYTSMHSDTGLGDAGLSALVYPEFGNAALPENGRFVSAPHLIFLDLFLVLQHGPGTAVLFDGSMQHGSLETDRFKLTAASTPRPSERLAKLRIPVRCCSVTRGVAQRSRGAHVNKRRHRKCSVFPLVIGVLGFLGWYWVRGFREGLSKRV